MNVYESLVSRQSKLALVGLGYVGMPIAVAFAEVLNVIGFDINEKKIKNYNDGIDPTGEVGEDVIKKTTVEFTSDPQRLSEAKFIIVAVPTPVADDHTPDLSPIRSACQIVGKNIKRGSVVVFESTVYPGVTREICIPIIEKESGMKCGIDWKIGYSPERINPGDKTHRLSSVVKIVSGMDKETLECVANVYSLVVKAGVYRAESIEIAEAAKVIENSQRDINIAFMNELSIIFHKMHIDTKNVLEAAGTKWNFLNFKPGLVGGHCIGIDPYYLTYRAEQFGYHSQIILSGRRINDDMGKYIAEQTVKLMIKSGINITNARVGCLGITFKENCPDVRNSKVNDVITELKEYDINPIVCDPVADIDDVKKLYNLNLVSMEELKDIDCLIIAVAHNEFKSLSTKRLLDMFKNEPNEKKVIVDIKSICDKEKIQSTGCKYWRL